MMPGCGGKDSSKPLDTKKRGCFKAIGLPYVPEDRWI